MNPREPFALPDAPMPDVQSAADTREIAIDQVGIKSIRHPLTVVDRSGPRPTVAVFGMFVSLPHFVKGTHMSRFVEMLNARANEISVETFESLARAMVDRLEAASGRIEASFPYFVRKRAPVSGVESLLDYEVNLAGEIHDGHYLQTLTVMAPITSLCPCSKEISQYGAHNQRSHATLTVHGREPLFIEDLLRVVEEEASCELFGLLKRVDEKYVTERAYERPKFVEDLVRDLAARLNADPRVAGYVVEAENFESIHNHSAYARIEKKARAD